MIVKRATTAVGIAAAALLAMAPPVMARDYHHHHGFRHHHDYHHRDHGNVGAGIAGFAAGAILGGALASHQQYHAYQPGPTYSARVRWCVRHYRSYDLRTHSYLGYDGYRHHCP